MSPLIEVAFSSINLPITILLILVLLYWVTVIIGVMDIDTLDFHLDPDLDVETEVDVSTGIDSAGSSIGMSILKFFYIGETPFMIVMTLFSFSSWVMAILSNHYFNPSMSVSMGAILFIPNFLASCLVVRIVGKPFSKFFEMLNKDLVAQQKMIGMPCTVTTSKVDENFGRAQIETETSPIIFNAITKEGESLKKGDSAVVLKFIEEKNTYIITSFE